MGETSHETSSSVYAQVAKCYHQSDKATVHTRNTQGHNHTCLSGKLPVHLFNCLSNLVFSGRVGGWTVVEQIMLFTKVQENRERVFWLPSSYKEGRSCCVLGCLYFFLFCSMFRGDSWSLSWSRMWRAGRHQLAPCRRDRWRIASASRLYSPCGKCACKAGIG